MSLLIRSQLRVCLGDGKEAGNTVVSLDTGDKCQMIVADWKEELWLSQRGWNAVLCRLVHVLPLMLFRQGDSHSRGAQRRAGL